MAAAVRRTRDRLTDAQRRALQFQRRRLGLDDATYRAALARHRCRTEAPMAGLSWPAYGQPCTSSSHLTRDQARLLITQWGLAGAPIGRPYSGSRTAAQADVAVGITALPSPAQRALIARLRAEVPWRLADGYQRWLTHNLHLDPEHDPRTYQQAESIIEGLRAMRDRPAPARTRRPVAPTSA